MATTDLNYDLSTDNRWIKVQRLIFGIHALISLPVFDYPGNLLVQIKSLTLKLHAGVSVLVVPAAPLALVVTAWEAPVRVYELDRHS